MLSPTNKPQSVVTSSLAQTDKSLYEYLCDLAISAAADLGLKELSEDSDLRAIQTAELKDRVMTKAERGEMVAGRAFRYMVYDMYASGDWINTRIEVINALNGKPALDESGEKIIRTFSTYEQWLEWRIADRNKSVKSGLRNGMKYLVPALEQGLIVDPKSGRPYTVPQALQMNQANWNIMAGKAFMLATTTPDGEGIGKLSDHMKSALTKSEEELTNELQAAGLTNNTIPAIEGMRIFSEDKTIVVMSLTPIQAKMLETRMGFGLKLVASTIDQAMSWLEDGLSPETDEVTEEDVQKALSRIS